MSCKAILGSPEDRVSGFAAQNTSDQRPAPCSWPASHRHAKSDEVAALYASS